MICVLFGGADIDDYGRVCIPEGAYVIAADGGYRHCVRLGIIPDLLIGDLDSNEEKLPDCEIITAPCEKDDTDLMMGVRKALESNVSRIMIYGADGGRMGHTYAAVQTLAFIEAHGCKGILLGNGFEMQVMGKGRTELHNDGYRYVSLFSLSDSSDISVRDLKYGGRITLTSDYPLGVSNEFTADHAEITVESGKILVILEK